MKKYRILAVLWLVLNCVGTVTVVRTLMSPAPNETAVLFYFLLSSFLMLDLIGIIASILLIRGAEWARWFLGSYAVLLVVGSIGQVVESHSLSTLTVTYGIFAAVSAVILLMPRRYASA